MDFTKQFLLTYLKTRISLDLDTGCWNWKLKCDRNGYARLNYKNAKNRWTVKSNVHRVVWQAWNDTIAAPRLVVAHKCNNRRCINPDHLELTTQKQNVAEQIRIGTHVTKNKSIRHKSKEEIADIAARLLAGHSCYSIAKLYGTTITDIINHRNRLNKKPKTEDGINTTITESLTFEEL